MCGICGLIDLEGKSSLCLSSAVTRMCDRLAHRGPDAEGVWSVPGISLGHRRLSIIDLESSRQPMVDPANRYVLVFNGEIYNYLELRQELEKLGFEFSTNGDTEVLLAAYVKYGATCLDHLNGMFSFAIWDQQDQVLFAARDRLGVKPFFYGQNSDGFFAFSSELQAMRGLPLDFSLSSPALRQYLRNGFIRSPSTIFRGINELRPAHFLRHSRRCGLEIQAYWQPPDPDSGSKNKSETELIDELREIFQSAVNIRLRSDVPLGAFLSGGLDSSIVVSSMKALGKTEIYTFAMGFNDSTFDESIYARQVSDYLGTQHLERIENLNSVDVLFDLVRHYGQPYGDSSAIPTWYLCRETRNHVTVALSGDGADELFCGYRRYLARRLLSWYQKIPHFLRKRVLMVLANSLPEGTGYYDHSLVKKMRLFVALDQRLTADPADIYPAYFNRQEIIDLFGGSLPCAGDEEMSELQSFSSRLSSIEVMMRSDLFHYLPDDILTKVDRASMAHGLEVRSPFMDYRLVEFACRLPLSYKLNGFTTKYLLRKAFAADLPSAPIKRRKHGFAVPMGEWFKGPLRSVYEDLVLTGNTLYFIDRSETSRLYQEHINGKVDHGHRLWLLLFLHAWHQWWYKED